ncbi:MAG: phasin family protein [Alphaproteobacteria bacterium]|nr:MAG: phasin family protein [Alphaproteobacteria bacterium]TAF14491.1 MAG: phasin family protein [Alphaproteobacteria bacterium]TAF76063.1 MAG: phasin family protein [Alphaproteobacteria bacterium]
MNSSDTPKSEQSTKHGSSSSMKLRHQRPHQNKTLSTQEGAIMNQPQKNATQKVYKAPQEQVAATQDPTNIVVIKQDDVESPIVSITEQLVERSQEGAQQLAHMAERVQRAMNETVEIGRTQMEAASQARAVATNCVSKLYEEWMSSTQKAIAENVDVSKELFACRTARDVFSLQSRVMQMNMERMLGSISRFSNSWCTMTAEASEPISDSINDAAHRLTKAFTE